MAFLVRIALMTVLVSQCASPEEPSTFNPGLGETIRFLQAALPSKVSYIVYGHDTIDGTDTEVKRSFELSVTSVDPDRCSISVRYRFDNGKTGRAPEKMADINLKEVEEVTVRPMEEVVQEVDDKQGHPEHRVKVDPPVFLVFVKTPADLLIPQFYDLTISQRVSKALQHAVVLCGGSTESE